MRRSSVRTVRSTGPRTPAGTVPSGTGSWPLPVDRLSEGQERLEAVDVPELRTGEHRQRGFDLARHGVEGGELAVEDPGVEVEVQGEVGGGHGHRSLVAHVDAPGLENVPVAGQDRLLHGS